MNSSPIIHLFVVVLFSIGFFVVDKLVAKWIPFTDDGSEKTILPFAEIPLFLLVIVTISQPFIFPSLSYVIKGGLLIGIAFLIFGELLYLIARMTLGPHPMGARVAAHYVTNGVYKLRHPIYISFFLITVGIFFVMPSFISILVSIYVLVLYTARSIHEERLRASKDSP